MKPYHLLVDSQSTGERLDRYLARKLAPLSRSQIAQWIVEGRVTLHHQALKASYRVQAGDNLRVLAPEKKNPEDLKPIDKPLAVVYEDDDLLVINKPAGLSVHPGAGSSEDTLVHRLLHHEPKLQHLKPKDRPGLVHRLDKDTTGLLVIAKTNSSQSELIAQFKARKVVRAYEALVLGCVSLPHGHRESHLARHPKHRKKFASTRDSGHGKWAYTEFTTLARQTAISLLECRLRTGRTHQIRVHLSEMGHPVLGDPLYTSPSKRSDMRKLSQSYNLNPLPMALHAYALGFQHPCSKVRLMFQVPWPDTMMNLIFTLGWMDVSRANRES